MNIKKESQVDLAIFTPTLEGGVGRVIVNLAKELSYQGYKIEIVTLFVKKEIAIPSEVSVVSLGETRTFKSLPKLIRYLRERKPDRLLSAIYHANLVALWAHMFLRSRSFLAISEHITLSHALQQEPFFLRIILRLLIRLFYPFADVIITVSEGAAQDLRERGIDPKKIRVIYNLVVTRDLFIDAQADIDHLWFRNKKLPIILGVGRLTEQKDFITLLKAFSVLQRRFPCRLVIIGEGKERERLALMAQELHLTNKIAFLGFIPNPYPYFKRADLFVLSSSWEGLPTVLIEAIALGVPVVSTDCESGPREILEHTKWGKLVPVGNQKKMAEAMEEMLQSHSKSLDKSRLDRFSSEGVLKNYISILFSCK